MGNLAGIVEADMDRLSELLQKYPVKCFTDLDEAISSGFDGYTVATPAVTHYPIGKKLLELGSQVLIEKPLTLSRLMPKIGSHCRKKWFSSYGGTRYVVSPGDS